MTEVKKLNVKESIIHAGADKSFELLHITDTHLTFADSRDGERKLKLAQSRERSFACAYEYLQEALSYAKEHKIRVLHTGDLIDFVSEKNLEAAAEISGSVDFMMAAGNHEYSLYVGEATENEDYKEQSFDAVQRCFKDNLRFQSRVVNGVNIVLLDNIYYYIRREELELFRNEIKKGLPIILCVHNPFHEEKLFKYMMNVKKEQCAYLVGCPDALTKEYPHDRFLQQRTNEKTREFYELINSTDAVKAVVAGHIHDNFESRLPGGAMQYVTGLTCKGDVRRIKVI